MSNQLGMPDFLDFIVLAMTILVIAVFISQLNIKDFIYSLKNNDKEYFESTVRTVKIRFTWKTVARRVKLVCVDQSPLDFDKDQEKTKRKVVTPRIKLTPDTWGVKIMLKTVPGISITEVQKSAPYLADEWKSVRVSATQMTPGKIAIRAVRRDPLCSKVIMETPPELMPNFKEIPVGIDEFAETVGMRIKDVSGIGVYGVPGSGKSSFISNVITRLSPFPNVQFVVLDGKVDDPIAGDYGDMNSRLLHLSGDDLEEANRILTTLVQFRKERARNMRDMLGTKNIWNTGFSEEWPLMILIIDEAHTYFSKVVDGGNRELKARNAMVAANIMAVEDLVKKGRSVGILTILATQKGTSDAIPTQIRDVCAVSVCFAVRTIESAIAALGEEIRQWPDSSPVELQSEEYVGVGVMKVEGRRGFTRVRMPLVTDSLVAQVTTENAHLRIEPKSLAAEKVLMLKP